MTTLANLPGLLEEAAEQLRDSAAPRDQSFEELSYAIDLALAAAYRFTAQAGEGPPAPSRTVARRQSPRLVLVASR